MPRPVSATSDIVFKFLFGSTTSARLLESFLNAVLADSGDPPVSELQIMNPVNDKQYFDDKLTIIDVRAKAADGTFVNVEIQMRSQTAFPERSLFYWSKTYADQLDETDVYGRLKPVIGVNLVGFRLFPDDLPFHTVFELRERRRADVVLTKDCTLHYLELPKLTPDLDTELGRWLYALKHLGVKEDHRMRVLLENNQNLTELAERYRRFDSDHSARQAYDDRVKYLRDQAHLLYTAEVEGRQKGLEEGRLEGREEGRKEGREEGLEEGGRIAAEAIARQLRMAGVDEETIFRATGTRL